MPEVQFRMPKMGESITDGKILSWWVKEGDTFEEGDILVEVATDKVDNEVPAPAAGRLLRYTAKALEVVNVGDVIAVLDLNTDIKQETSPEGSVEKPAVVSQVKKSKSVAKTGAFTVNENVFVSPLVDSIARKHHISYDELARITGTGKDGRLRKTDVLSYVSEGRPFQFTQAVSNNQGFQIPDLKFDKGTGQIVPMDRMREMIADHMVYSCLLYTSPSPRD